MSQDIVPAIARSFTDADRDADVRSTLHDSVQSRPGWGDSGYRVQMVNFDCPECGFDRMIRRWDVNPEFGDEVRYWCLNPNCPYYLRDELSYACHGSYPQNSRSEPAVMDFIEI